MRKVLIRAVSVTAAAGLTMGLMTTTAGSAEAASGCKISYSRYPGVHAGSRGTGAKSVQCLLRRAGYSARVDGSFSTADAAKLKAFQYRHRLSGTGHTSGRTWAALISSGSRPTLHRGSRGSDVRRLQLSLRALGHRELPGTTYYGPLTQAAVKSQQRSLGWRTTGVATNGLWASLQVGGLRPVIKHTTTKKKHTKKSSKKKHVSSSTKGTRALAFAKRQLGERYVYGAAGPNAWDCSGLTMMAWRSAGVRLSHNTGAQYRQTRKISKSQLRPGDLVFFYSGRSHVALYAGHGMVLHAPNSRSRVSYIKMSYMSYNGASRPG